MAGNKINTKTKTKDDKAKNRNTSPVNEDTEEPDFTLLRKPIHTSITGFAQARKVFDVATEELKTLLTNECDILYECKVCRNIFRSLANFISHKRIYCKETFDSSVHGHFVRTLSAASELSRIKKIEELCNKSKDDNIDVSRKEWEDRIPLSKDLTEIIERLASSKGIVHKDETPQVVLQEIPKSNVAVFQNIKSHEDNIADMMVVQVNELYSMMSKENAVLKSDGTVEVHSPLSTNKGSKESENVIQISDDDELGEGDILKCKICDLQFSTQKTLKFHMKYKHLESRLVYPCPDCLEIFSTSWSVYRHLFKVHRKTAAQIRRLRESIQSKAFRMNNPPAFYEKRKNNVKNTSSQKITEEERLDQENQAWMDNLEGDEVPRCGGCGRTFERRAALAAHTHTCQSRSRALARRPPDSRKIEIQIRKDYNKAPPPAIALPLKIMESNGNKQINEEGPDLSKSQEKESGCIEKDKSNNSELEKSNDSSLSKQNADENISNKNKSDGINSINLPFARQSEISNFNAFNKQCQLDIEIDKLQCKKCNNTFSEDSELYEHMAEHYKWLRYACKLCNFKHYNFDKLPEHVRLIHKLKGDTDFYYSTVKAIDGVEAFQLSECSKITNERNEKSPDSRRPSRCSSDSSRLSDDSSSSSTRAEGARKRKMKYNKSTAKKKKELIIEDTDDLKDSEGSNDLVDETESALSLKLFEENSSDIDEVDEKLSKKPEVKSAITALSSRPVRKRTNKKNEDFEYDLSNLLKMEAQGYRDSQTVVTPKQVPTKKKSSIEVQNDTNINKYVNETYNNDYAGALAAVAKKEVAAARAHIRCAGRSFQGNTRNVFLRPMLPKFVRTEKISPKKDALLQAAEFSKLNKIEKQEADVSYVSENGVETKKCHVDISIVKESDTEDINFENFTNKSIESSELSKKIPAKMNLVPVKVRRQSLDVVKNPLIKNNLAAIPKVGKNTKILVIKPINRNNDQGKTINTPRKYQTIKLTNKTPSSNNEKVLEPVRVVPVPKVNCPVKLPITNTYKVKKDMVSPVTNTEAIDDKSHTKHKLTENVIEITDETSQPANTSNNTDDKITTVVDKLLDEEIKGSADS